MTPINSFYTVILARLQERMREGKSTTATFGDLWNWCRAAESKLPLGSFPDRRGFSRELFKAVKLGEADGRFHRFSGGAPGEEKLVHIDLTKVGKAWLADTMFSHQERLGKFSQQVREE